MAAGIDSSPSLHRTTLALRGVLRAIDLVQARDGRRVRVAGMVITRQRPGTAKGFVFLTLEDETGISNVIIRPDLFDRQRTEAARMPFLLVDGIMQQQDGVRSVTAERLETLDTLTRRWTPTISTDVSLGAEGVWTWTSSVVWHPRSSTTLKPTPRGKA